MSTGEHTSDSPQLSAAQTDEVWEAAKRRHIPLALLKALALAPAIGAFWAFSEAGRFTTSPSSGDVKWAIGAAAGIFLLLSAIGLWQTTSSPERFVSPLLALESPDRSRARADLNTATPASDPRLRTVELMTATQRTTMPPASRAFGIVPGLLLVLAGCKAWSDGESANCVAMITAGLVFAGGNELLFRRQKAAERFLAVFH